MIVFISPHLDDVVFSCGTLVASLALANDVEIVTVFGGSDERHEEDIDAATILGAAWQHLRLPEGSDSATVAKALGEAKVPSATGPTFAPWGIRHADHGTVADACMTFDYGEWFRYEELPYRVLWPEHLPHPMPQPILELPASAVKMAAVACYQSQLGGPAGEALWAGERYHHA